MLKSSFISPRNIVKRPLVLTIGEIISLQIPGVMPCINQHPKRLSTDFQVPHGRLNYDMSQFLFLH